MYKVLALRREKILLAKNYMFKEDEISCEKMHRDNLRASRIKSNSHCLFVLISQTPHINLKIELHKPQLKQQVSTEREDISVLLEAFAVLIVEGKTGPKSQSAMSQWTEKGCCCVVVTGSRTYT